MAELGDLHFQRATWLDPEMQNPHYSFVEFVECFYSAAAGDHNVTDQNASNAPFAYQVSKDVLSSKERDALWPLHLTLNAYDEADAYDHATILDDPAWHAVVEVAAAATTSLTAILEDPIDHRAFENLLPSPAAKRWP